jgi:hypothetical protein
MPHEHMSIFKHYWHHTLVLQSEDNLEAGKSAGIQLQRLTPKPTVNYTVNLTKNFEGK